MVPSLRARSGDARLVTTQFFACGLFLVASCQALSVRPAVASERPYRDSIPDWRLTQFGDVGRQSREPITILSGLGVPTSPNALWFEVRLAAVYWGILFPMMSSWSLHFKCSGSTRGSMSVGPSPRLISRCRCLVCCSHKAIFGKSGSEPVGKRPAIQFRFATDQH